MLFLAKLILPLGITIGVVFLIVVLTGLRVLKLGVKVHRLLALIGCGLALVHTVAGFYVLGIIH